jgi:metallo-beta-lactamase family protein
LKIKFWGAAQTVTGSCHLLNFANQNILLDCGLFQGTRSLAKEYNTTYPVPPASVQSVVLSHAHIDHSGRLPALVANGFKGKIHATSATADLCKYMLRDSAHIQESDADFLNRRAQRKGSNDRVEPLYTTEDADRALNQFETHQYDKEFKPTPSGFTATYRDAGHILGSAFVEMVLSDSMWPHPVRVTFSGDLGRKNMPILKDPETPAPADVLIIESTYGDRLHDDIAMAEGELGDAVNRVIARGGKIIIPAFSVGRTQEIVYSLNRLWNQGRLPRIPVYVDSPLSVNVTEVFRNHPECYDEFVMRDFKTDPDPFGFQGLIYIRDVEASKKLNKMNSPCIIISSSGMAENGRIVHHLRNNLQDARNAVFVVGYMAENTLGRRLVEKQKEVKIFGDTVQVNAEIVVFNAFSGHGDANDLTAFASDVAREGTLKKIFLVHGDIKPMEALKARLTQTIQGCQVIIPARGDEFSLV